MPPSITQIRHNCQIASAGQVGLYSLCGMLMRLRQLYKWEHHLLPWQEAEPQEILQWIEDREEMWAGLEETPFADLIWEENGIDPFNVESINAEFIPQGLAYGAGYSRGLRPTFFLGELEEVRYVDGLTILVTGPELARDLNSHPGLRQGQIIYLRKEALAYYLWDQLADPTQQKNPFLQVALSAYAMPLLKVLRDPAGYQEQFQTMLAAEAEALIHHEIGEAREFALRTAFPTLLELFPQTKVEPWIRALKDALAEMNDWGRLQYLISRRHLPSLALMLAWRPGFYPLLLPELEPAFAALLQTGDWQVMEAARLQALSRLRLTAAELNALVAAIDPEQTHQARQEIETRFLTPLGV